MLGIVANMGIELTPEQRREILYIPTKNMQAFLEYCNGLEKQDAGQLDAAGQHFKRALQIDPNFKLGRQKADDIQAALSMRNADEKTAHRHGVRGGKPDHPAPGIIQQAIF